MNTPPFTAYKPAPLPQSLCARASLLIRVGVGWLFDAMDVGILAFLLAALQADWGLSAAQLGYLGSANALGMAVGAIVFGMLADRIGRQPVFVLTLALFSLASGLSAFATGFIMMLCLRFVIGLGLGGELPVAATYISELMPENQRGRAVVLLESFWALGWILAAVLAYFVIPHYGWRFAMLCCALPALYAIYIRRNLPRDIAPRPIRQEGSLWGKIWGVQHRRATGMLWVLWFSIVFSYYGMFLWLPSVMVAQGFSLIKSFEYMLGMSLAQLPGYFSAAWLIERQGRKFVLVVYLTGTALSALAFGLAETPTTLVISGAFLSFFNLGAWGALYAYTPEQYPQEIRGGGSGAAAACGRLGGILGPLTLPWMQSLGSGKLGIFILFTAVLLVGVLVVLFWGRETKPSRVSVPAE